MRWLITLMITTMIFFPDKTFYEKPADYGYDSRDVSLITKDGVKLHGWFLKAPGEKAVMLHLHGNAGNISGRLSKVKGWVDRGISVLLVDYRSYGQSEGKITNEADLVTDAEAALNWLVNVEKHALSSVIIYGESLGTYPAIRLAAAHPAAALVLEAPFTSFVDLAGIHYSIVPGKELLLKDFRFANREWIEKIQPPVFFVHGTHDEICPYSMSEELFEEAPGAKGFFSIPNGTHNDLPIRAGEDYWQKPYEFVEKHLE